MRFFVTLGLGLSLIGCGLAAPGGQIVTGEAGGRSVQSDDSDLSGGALRQGALKALLEREAVARDDGGLRFSTRRIASRAGTPRLPRAGGPIVSGALRFPDRRGTLVPAERVTVHLSTPGALGRETRVSSVLTDAAGAWSGALPAALLGKPLHVSFELANRHWTIQGYRWEGPSVPSLAASNDMGVQALEAGSQNAQAGLVHQDWLRAIAVFEREGIALDWWARPIKTVWPASADFYNFGSVNLTDATHWDVNGHEIGHAMYFAGLNAASGGGPHKIDECYGASLAFSEGFGSFFSAAAGLRRDDPDARFEFMVPRRAPIRIENVPSDVCEGYTNEWRAAAALWDLYDTHDDGTDRVALTFKEIWGALVKTQGGPRMNDVRDAFRRIADRAPASERQALADAFAQSGIPVGVGFALK